VPKRITDAELVAYLEGALASEHGLEIQTQHIDYLRRRFYALKKHLKDSGDARFDELRITSSPNKRGCLWLMKEEIEDVDEHPA